MRAMVLCAGFGTRLRPLTDKIPKPLVPLCGLPLLRYNFALLKNAGVEEIVVNTHHLGAEMEKGARAIAAELGLGLQVSREEKQILGTGGGVRRAEKLLGDGTFFLLNGDMIFDVDLGAALAAHRKAGAIAAELGLGLQVSREEKQILGTGGGVRKAQAMLGGGTFFLLNGDMLFDIDLSAALAAHRAAKAVATMVLAPYPKGASYGAVEVDKEFNVRRIAGRGAASEPGSWAGSTRRSSSPR